MMMAGFVWLGGTAILQKKLGGLEVCGRVVFLLCAWMYGGLLCVDSLVLGFGSDVDPQQPPKLGSEQARVRTGDAYSS